ncbi:nucleotide-diphospho-sugar transferase [Blastocladiella britannica]|nr:nucleotide-diphospho-sugar transferase [Blastocladiella britannica]
MSAIGSDLDGQVTGGPGPAVAATVSDDSKYDQNQIAAVPPLKHTKDDEVPLPQVAPRALMRTAASITRTWSQLRAKNQTDPKWPLPPLVHTKWRDTAGVPSAAAACLAAWREKNPGVKVLVWTDRDASEFVMTHHPHVYDTYQRVPRPVMRADLVRALLLMTYGGMWIDIDACPLQPMSHWNLTAQNALVVGVEADMESPLWKEHFARQFQFLTWTFAAVPGHPAMSMFARRALSAVEARLNDAAPIGDHDVLDLTGPGMFTDAIMEYLGMHGDTSFKSMHFMPERMHFGDAVVMPLWSFSPGSWQRDSSRPWYSRTDQDPEALVKHLFLGSWRDNKDRSDGSMPNSTTTSS